MMMMIGALKATSLRTLNSKCLELFPVNWITIHWWIAATCALNNRTLSLFLLFSFFTSGVCSTPLKLNRHSFCWSLKKLFSWNKRQKPLSGSGSGTGTTLMVHGAGKKRREQSSALLSSSFFSLKANVTFFILHSSLFIAFCRNIEISSLWNLCVLLLVKYSLYSAHCRNISSSFHLYVCNIRPLYFCSDTLK